MILRRLIFPTLLFTTAVSVTIFPECQPKSQWREPWHGSEAKIIAFFEFSSSEGQQSSQTKNLTLEYTFRNLKINKYYDFITVSRLGIEIIRSRDGTDEKKDVFFPEPLEFGWQEFEFRAASTVEMWHNSNILVSLPKFSIIERLTIEGSNVTVKCSKLDFGWTVSSGESALIPFGNHNENHHQFSFYSNGKYQPVITLSNTNESVRLGWQGFSMTDTTIIQDHHQSPLPAFTEHRISISCSQDYHRNFECSLVNSKENKKMKTYSLSSLPKSVSLASGNNEEFWVFLHRPEPTAPTEPPQLHEEGNPEEERDATAFQVTIVILLALCIPLTAYIMIQLTKQKTTQKMAHLIGETAEDQEKISLLDTPNTSQNSLHGDSFASLMDPRMWEAVVEGDPKLVEYLIRRGVSPYIAETRRQTSAYVEAHILGQKEILQLMFSYSKKPSTTTEDLIESIIYEHERRMRKIFKAAKLGIYTRDQGVKLLLQAHSLPATIMDHKGRSLIHYMASSHFLNGRPAWDAKDVKDFLEYHDFYINAVDFWGSTALHKLATPNIEQRNKNRRLHWGGQENTLVEIWLDVAQIFLDKGCDPRIADHRGFLAHELAIENGHHRLAALLKKEYDRLGEVDHTRAIDEFPRLAEAAGKGDTNGIIQLLKNHVPLLPICAQTDPLVEAIRCNQRETVFLLLSAGAPLTNQSIEDSTPMEAAHYTVGLPAFFPALMRKVYSNKLLEEKRHIPFADQNYERLSRSMEEYAQQMIKTGCEAKWTFTQEDNELEPDFNIKERSTEARQLLGQAAEHGLSLVCQILSMENVYLHSIHFGEKPFSKAVKNKQVYTQLALCRDLKISPFASRSSSLEIQNVNLNRHIFISQLKILVNKVKDPSDHCLYDKERSKIQNYIENLKQVSLVSEFLLTTQELQAPPDMLLYLVAEHGLDAILWIIANRYKYFDINRVIDFSGGTLLHIASMYGQLNVIELLIYHGAKLDQTTIGGFTPAHLAALSGHKETFAYMKEYMESKGIQMNQKCDIGLLALEMMDLYAKFCENHEACLISHEDALHVKNEKGAANQAYEMLKRKGEKMLIHNPCDLFQCVVKNASAEEDMAVIQRITETETKRICDKLTDTDFEGNIDFMGPLAEENEVFSIYNVSFILELTKHCGLGVAPTVTCKRTRVDNNPNTEITSQKNQELFSGTNFIQKFYQALENSLREYEASSSDISLAPPFLKTSNKGICFYLVMQRNHGYVKIAVQLVPVIAVPLPEESRFDEMSEEELVRKNQNHIHLYFCSVRRKWRNQFYHFNNLIFSSLSEDEKQLWMTCHFISSLLSPYAWAPMFNTKRYFQPWHTLSVGVKFPQPSDIKILFLNERKDRKKSKGDKDLFKWLLAIYERAVYKDEFGKWKANRIESYYCPGNFKEGKEAVGGILRYLEMLQDEGDRV